jgi:PAS domain S-box-containing protein
MLGADPGGEASAPSRGELERGRYRSLVTTSRDAIVQPNTAGEIVGWNQGAEDMVGYEADEIRGAQLTAIMAERYREGHREGLDRFLDTGEAKIIGQIRRPHVLRSHAARWWLQRVLTSGSDNFIR